MKFNIITPCNITKNLLVIRENIFKREVDVDWHILFNTSRLKDIDAELLNKLQSKNTFFYFMESIDQIEWNKIVNKIKEGWIYFLRDENVICDNFYEVLEKRQLNSPNTQLFIFNQFLDGKDFSKQKYRFAKPENTKFGKVDLSQVLFYNDVFKNYKFGKNTSQGGRLIEKYYIENKTKVDWIDENIANLKFLKKPSNAKLPKIMYVGEDTPELTSNWSSKGGGNKLEKKYLKDSTNINKEIVEFKPDLIITELENLENFKYHNLLKLPYEFKKKLAIRDKKHHEFGKKPIGWIAYDNAMHRMMSKNNLEDPKTISFTTPIYNTGKKLHKTYETLKNQTYKNWEWVLINDSTDEGYTLKIAEQIARLDPRVKVYDFREKSGGCIGEVKWRACTMAKGYLLAELDHDDLLTENCAMDLHKAAQKHPECGFFFTDWVELYENGNSSRYDGGVNEKKPWAFGYGSYRIEEWNGKKVNVAQQHNVNPKTIRHIVGIPNHIRAWRRSTYFEIGGHNRNLTVADDYELFVRTFLKTKICKIPKLAYLQMIYNNELSQNTHNLSRQDIQRRTKSIQMFYNKQINARFKELGFKDWAYEHSPNDPLSAPSKFGDEEGFVNIIYEEET